MVFLDWAQAVDLAEAHRDRYRALIYLAVDSGMRWSELIGLRRSKLDLRTRKVRVTEQLVRLETGEWLRKEPKTPASVRSITLSSVTAEILARHLERLASTGPDGLVFPDAAGNPIAAASFWNNHFSRAQRASGVSCRFHDLRHSSVALAIAAGAIRKPSRRGWVIRRSTSPSTATTTSFPSWMKRSPPPSPTAYLPLAAIASPGSCTRLLAGNETAQSRAGRYSPTD